MLGDILTRSFAYLPTKFYYDTKVSYTSHISGKIRIEDNLQNPGAKKAILTSLHPHNLIYVLYSKPYLCAVFWWVGLWYFGLVWCWANQVYVYVMTNGLV